MLQHLAEERQIAYKQQVLLDNLQRIGHVAPASVLPPLHGQAWGYRRKGRFSVRRVEKKDKTLVGFREQDPRFVADLRECHVVVPQLGFRLEALGARVVVVRVNATDATRAARGWTPLPIDHDESETALDGAPCDILVHNDTSVAAATDSILARLRALA